MVKVVFADWGSCVVLLSMGGMSLLMKPRSMGSSVSGIRLQVAMDCSSRQVNSGLYLPLVRLKKISLQ